MKSYKKKKDAPKAQIGYRTPSTFRASKFGNSKTSAQVKHNPSAYKTTQHRG